MSKMEKSENIDEQLPDQLATNSDPTEETKQRTTTGNTTVSLKNKKLIFINYPEVLFRNCQPKMKSHLTFSIHYIFVI